MTIIKLSHQQFFSVTSDFASMELLLKESLKTKAPLKFKIENDTVQILNDKQAIGSKHIYIKMSTLSNDLAGIKPSTRKQKLLLPFLVDLEELAIPSNQIISLSKRSIANSFIRNLFSASVRNCVFNVDQVPNSKGGIISSMLRTHYYYYYKHMLPEEKLKDVDAGLSVRLLALNAYIDARYFNRNLLNASLDEIHQDVASEDSNLTMEKIKQQILDLRSQSLNKLKG